VEGDARLALWTGLVFGAAPLSAAFMSPIWGALGDRLGRRLMVLRSMLAITFFVGAMAWVQNPWQLLALRLLQGVFSGFVAPSLTLVSVGAPAHEQGRIASSLQVAMSLGAVAGPMWGELVREVVGQSAVYLSVSALSLVSALLVFFFASEDETKRRARSGPVGMGSILRESLGDLAELRASRTLRAAVVLLFFIQFGSGASLPLLELYVRDLHPHFASVPKSTAALFSVPAAMNLLAMPLWGRYGDRSGHSRALLRCAWMSGILLALHAAVFGYEELFGVRLLFGLALAGAGPLAFGVAGVEISEDRRGGAMGVVFSARAFAIASSAMLGGALAGWLGIRGLFVCGGAAILVPFWAFSRARRASGAIAAPAGEVPRGIGEQ
jgi:DHA1 family multidrug resistance protein-like MFS transporter